MGLYLMTIFTKKVFGLAGGDDNGGLKHWFYQKLSAIAMLPLTLWFVVKLPHFISLSYQSKVDWIITFPNSVLYMLFFIVASFHMRLGLTVVIEDYIHNNRVKSTLLIFITIFSFVLPVKVVVLVLLLRGTF